jgi:LCP family protein required for cell wall assembly
MRTTLKWKVGLGPDFDASGEPNLVSAVARYQAAPRPHRSGLRRAARVLSGLLLAVVAVAAGAAGGAYLWLDRTVADVQILTPAVKHAEAALSLPLPGKPAIALLLGVDSRAGAGAGSDNTDAMMLVRANPANDTISLLSFPRDLNVPIYCSNTIYGHDRINAALADCGPKGVLETVEHLTGLPVNYLITVDFHGFKKIVNELGGIWIDVDRTYYNKNVGTAATDYSNIDLQPGYQLMSGGAALSFVRFRHTDSDLYRLAREQEFIHAIKDQVARNFDPLKLPGLVSAITSNVQVAAKTRLSDTTVLEYALFGATLPAGHIVQIGIPSTELIPLDVGGADELSVSATDLQAVVSQFERPQVIGAAKHTDRNKPAPVVVHHLRPKPHPSAPAPAATTLTVLNGNGVVGAAADASGLLGDQGYHVLPPPGGAIANAPTMTYPETQIYFDPTLPHAAAAAAALASLIRPAAAHVLPSSAALRALDPHAMLLVVLGRSFTGSLTLPRAPARIQAAVTPPTTPASAAVELDPSAGSTLLEPLARRVGFKLEDPTELASSSVPDTFGGDQPVRLYSIVPHNQAVRLVFVTAGGQFWGVEETAWSAAPILDDISLTRTIKGRSYDLYYAGGHLHMIVLRANGATYWVVNTLLNSLTNATMVAIAEGLEPLGSTHAT